HTVKVWDAATGEEVLTLKGHTAGVASVAFSPDGRRLASASGDRTVRVWDTATGQALLTLRGHTGGVRGVAFSPDGTRLASVGGPALKEAKPVLAMVWDLATAKATELKGHAETVHGVAFSPDGKRLASGSSDRTVKVWDAATGEELITLRGHTGPVASVAFSP